MPALPLTSMRADRRSSIAVPVRAAATLMALALPSVAPARIEDAVSAAQVIEPASTAWWDARAAGFDFSDAAIEPRFDWSASDPLRCAVRHDVLDGFRIEGGVGCVPDSGAWRRFLRDDASAPEEFGADELFRLDATIELVAELGDLGGGTGWRVGLGGGWSRAESVLGAGLGGGLGEGLAAASGTDPGSRGLGRFLADEAGGLHRAGAGDASGDLSGDISGEGVVWLRFSRAF